MNIVMIGPQGSGKGTQAKILAEKYGIPHISTGDIFRDMAEAKDPLGLKAMGEYINKGLLVPDEITIGLVKKRLASGDAQKGYILDGFPRTIPQAEALEKSNIKIDKVINFIAKYKTIIERLSGRRTCEKCNAIYHIKTIPPKKQDVCDKCGGELFLRDDDKPGAIKKRLEVYIRQTEPLIGFYKKKDILIDIETEKLIPEIVKDVLAIE